MTKILEWVKKHHLVWILLLVVTIYITRGTALDQYVMNDERWWMMRSGNFYHALSNGNLINTRQNVDPAVTTMWINTAAFLIEAPQYKDLDAPNFKGMVNFNHFLQSNNIDAHQLLITGRRLMLLENIILLVLAFILSIRLLGIIPAFSAFMLIALDPWHITWTMVTHTDGQLSCLMLLSVISFLCYAFDKPKIVYLVISAIAAALASLTKLPGYLLFAFFAGFILYELLKAAWKYKFERGDELTKQAKRALVGVAIWLVTFAVVYVAVWPVMWVDPIGTLEKQVSGPFRFMDSESDGDNVTTATTPESGVIDSSSLFENMTVYPDAFLWHTTPIVLIGIALAVLMLLFQAGVFNSPDIRRFSIILFLYALFFIGFISLVDKQNDRYMIPAVVLLDIVAALGWVALFQLILKLKIPSIKYSLTTLILAGILAVQIGGIARAYPYFGSYFNPLMGGAKKAGMIRSVASGEGLDEAGRYLSAKPGASDMTVMSWFGTGCFSYYFSGMTINIGASVTDQYIAENIGKADYLVVNQSQWILNKTPRLMEILARSEPEHRILINQIEFARIYRVDGLPPEIFTHQ